MNLTDTYNITLQHSSESFATLRHIPAQLSSFKLFPEGVHLGISDDTHNPDELMTTVNNKWSYICCFLSVERVIFLCGIIIKLRKVIDCKGEQVYLHV